MTSINRIEKLTETNYPSWAAEMEAVLIREDMWDVVIEPLPSPATAEQTRLARKAKATMLLSISKQLQHLIIGETVNAHQAWLKLKNVNASTCKARTSRLKKELYGLMQLDSESCSNYFARADRLRQQLIAAGTVVSDEDFKETLVGGIHTSFEGVKEIVNEWVVDTTKTAIDILARLHVTEQQRAKKPTKIKPDGAALVTDEPKFKCFYCHKMGHRANRCPKKKKDRENKVCDYCNKHGHTKEECHARKRAEAAANAVGSALICRADDNENGHERLPTPHTAAVAYAPPFLAPAAPPVAPPNAQPAPSFETALHAAPRRPFFPAEVYDPSDFMLREDLFLSLDDEFGPFDIDIAANESGGNAQCDEYLYKGGNDFFNADIPAGARVYANPPFRYARKWLERHRQNKMRDPTMSAVWILPLDRKAEWWPYTKQMSAVRVWNRGTHIFSMPGKRAHGGARRFLKPCPFDVVALYDPPRDSKGIALAADVNTDTVKFVVDSGATFHMTPRLDILHNIRELNPKTMPTSISAADGNNMRVVGAGDVTLEVNMGSRTQLYTLKDVLYVPGLAYNLLSIAKLADSGTHLVMHKDRFELYPKDGAPPLSARRNANMYLLHHKVIKPSKVFLPERCYDIQHAIAAPANAAPQRDQLPNTASNVELVHRRLGHLGYTSMAKLPMMVDGCSISAAEIAADAKNRAVCEHCLAGRQTRDTRPDSQQPKSTELLHRLYTDICGPFPESMEGNKYFLIAVDEASRYSALVPMQRKSETARNLQLVISAWERRTDRSVKHVRCDQGKEFLSNDLLSKFERRGIKMETTATYSPESNGMAERCNRTILDKVRAMMAWARAPEDVWDEAAMYANILRNVSPAANLPKTPYEYMYGLKPDISRLRVFGSVAYVFIPKDLRRKLDQRSEPAILLSADPAAKKYRVLTSSGISVSRDVVCDETKPGWATIYVEHQETPPPPRAPDTVLVEIGTSDVHSTDNSDAPDNANNNSSSESNDADDPWEPSDTTTDKDEEVEGTTSRRFPARARREPERYGFATAAVKNPIIEPTTVAQAKTLPEWPEWQQAMQAEMDALLENGTWELSPTPPGTKPLPNKWVFKVKWAPDGSIERFKARLVVGGHRQRDGIDYSEVYAPVGRFASLRALMGKAAHDDLELVAVDISNAFLHGKLDQPIYMRQPDGFATGDANVSCKLIKTLYGLKQSPKEWYNVLSEGLSSFGFSSCDYDRALWCGHFDAHTVYLLHWVDDIILACDSKAVLSDVKTKILTKFKGRDLGNAEQYLNIKIERDRKAKTLKLSQPTHVSELLDKFHMSDSKPRAVPLLSSADTTKIKDNEQPFEPKTQYQECVGGLMYIASVSRPDLCLPVSILAKHMASPAPRHWEQLKGLLRYVNGTRNLGITYGVSSSTLDCFTDSDWGACKDTRRSRSGFVFNLFGGAISWTSKQQTVVATSTAEAEYVATALCAREAIWLKKIVNFLSIECKGAVVLRADNQAAIKMASNASDSSRTKHIDITYHFLRHQVTARNIRMVYVSTDDNPADMFTKPLPAIKLDKFKCMIGML